LTTKNTKLVHREEPTKTSHLRTCASFVIDVAVLEVFSVLEGMEVVLERRQSNPHRFEFLDTRRPLSDAMDFAMSGFVIFVPFVVQLSSDQAPRPTVAPEGQTVAPSTLRRSSTR